jgi:hypothetical protein
VDISEEQKQTIAAWVKEGTGLSDIQKRLAEELDLPMTYMDVRFLIIDLGLDVHDKPEPAAKPELTAIDEPAADLGATSLDDAVSPGGVSVEVDRVTKPGTIVSGTVTFSDGASSAWSLDQFGRLALDPGSSDSRPSPEDLQVFQEELKRVLEKRGF